MKISKSKKIFIFKIDGLDMSYVSIKAYDKETAVAIMKSILRNLRKRTGMNCYRIYDMKCIDEETDISVLYGVLF